jgi:hypothetical protein
MLKNIENISRHELKTILQNLGISNTGNTSNTKNKNSK